jgi:hypothetical protein
MPAIWSGDPVYQKTTRVYGIIVPDNPVYQELADEITNGMKAECGVKIKQRTNYSINVATMAQQSVTVIATQQSQGVTTPICICDPAVENFLSQAADQQKYYPEWLVTPWLDPQGRTQSQKQWGHAISGEGTYPANGGEAYRVFKMAKPKAEPAEKYYVVAYYTALYVFSALQGAGPDLNPQTFQRSVFNMPRSDLGDFGTWGGGPEQYSPPLDAQIGWWDVNAKSNMDGKKGAWISCENNKWFSLSDPNAWGPAHTQFHCFGK